MGGGENLLGVPTLLSGIVAGIVAAVVSPGSNSQETTSPRSMNMCLVPLGTNSV